MYTSPCTLGGEQWRWKNFPFAFMLCPEANTRSFETKSSEPRPVDALSGGRCRMVIILAIENELMYVS